MDWIGEVTTECGTGDIGSTDTVQSFLEALEADKKEPLQQY